MTAEPGLDVPEGTALNLSCLLPGGSGPTGNSSFTWFWNRHRLHSAPVPTLSFTPVVRAQAGLYHCRADLPTGATTSAPVMLRVLCEYEPISALCLSLHLTGPYQAFSSAQSKGFIGKGLRTLASSLAGCMWFVSMLGYPALKWRILLPFWDEYRR